MILSFFKISVNPLEFGRVSKKCPSPQPPATFCLRVEAPMPAQKLLGQNTKKKNVLSFLPACRSLGAGGEKIGRAQIRKARNIFLWCPPRLCEAVTGRLSERTI